MKKVFVGCLVVLVFGMIATCAGGYFFVWRPISGFVAEGNAFLNYEARLTNQEPYAGPADFRLTAEQVERFVAINRAVDASLGENVDAMREVLNQQASSAASIGEMLGALGELKRLMSIAVAARDVQITAMNTANMSAAEYRWIRDRFLSALVPGVNLSQLQESFKDGSFQIPGLPQLPELPAIPGVTAPSGAAPTGTTEADKTDAPTHKSKTDDKPPPPTNDPKPDSARVAPTQAAIEVVAPAAPAAPAQPAAAPAGDAAAAPPSTDVDIIAQLPGGREAYEHNRALIEPYREEAMGWIRNWAASF